jgi:protein SCO1/2
MGGQLSARIRAAGTGALLVALLGAGAACSRPEPPRRYPLTGQVLAVHRDRQQLTIKHEDIAGFMPGMTMSFPVASPSLLDGREPGELIRATLEVRDSTGRLVEVTHAGTAPLPETTNEVAMAGGILAVGDAVPDAAFIDQSNARRSWSELTGTPLLLTFIYTRCPLPDFCPLMDQNFATIQRAAAEDAVLRGRIRLVSISFDPDYDTPGVLAKHAARLKADAAVWTFLTGDRVTLDRFAGRLGIGLIRPADATDITHNLRTFLIGADGRIAKIYAGSDWTPSQAIGDLRAALQRP